MPKLNDPNMEAITTTSNYGFSAVKLDNLGASEYTLATIVCDISGSLYGQERELEKMIAATTNSCKKSPKAENLMQRVVFFNSQEHEFHGFKLLDTIQDSDYDNAVQVGGTTALYDATFHSIEATNTYAKTLLAQDYLTNAIIFIITDGMDNCSTYGPLEIKKLVEKVKMDENMESVVIVLIGMTDITYTNDPNVTHYLQIFKDNADLTDYIEIGAVSPSKLAKLAKFISRSVSSTSQALGSGGPSQSLTF